METRSWSRVPPFPCLSLVLSLGLLACLSPREVSAQPVNSQASQFCHVTDGVFTDCDPGRSGSEEWSDVPAVRFADSKSVLYVNQNTSHSTLYLLYDFPFRTTGPLSALERVEVTFDTVEDGKGGLEFERYVVEIFGDGSFKVQVNGREAPAEGILAAAGFEASPNLPQPHLLAELEVPLAPGGATTYSPDPLWWSATAPPACTVAISGGSPVMNVGQLAQFTASLTSAPGSGVVYQWSVDGAVLKDYSETTDMPWSTTPMSAADFQGPALAFYWKPDASQIDPANGGPVARKVKLHVEVTNAAGSGSCDAEVTIAVERNDSDVTKQAEDYYTGNHIAPAETAGRARLEHAKWHADHPLFDAGYDGTLFFDFHHAYIDRFNAWRSEFGYPPVGLWDPGTPLPTGPDIDHTPRNPVYVPQPKPSWFTIAGGAGERPSNGWDCDTTAGQTRLCPPGAGFPADRKLLGCAVTSPWHNDVHVNVGGDMGSTLSAVRDPIFWRWHNFVDVISAERMACTPPQVVYQSPFRLFQFRTAFPSTVQVTFNEVVTGVTAGLLTVNGSPATQVTGSGAGPYAFTGFLPPGLGNVMVSLAAGQVRDTEGLPFAGTSWTHVLLAPSLDDDGDGLSNEVEARVTLTNPETADTDGDGLPDSFESANAECMDPFELEVSDSPLDPDGDGLSNQREFHLGTDPCGDKLVPFRNVVLAGDYVAAGVGLRSIDPEFPPPITVSGIPEGAVVKEAYLYWGLLADEGRERLSKVSLNGVPIQGALLAVRPDTCWGRNHSFAYRADVTALVRANGMYRVGGMASDVDVLAEGASLVVLYEGRKGPFRKISLLDGNVAIQRGLRSATSRIPPFVADAAPSARTTFIVGDGMAGASDSAVFAGGAGSRRLDDPFVGSDGELWDTLSEDVSADVAAGEGAAEVTVARGNDCVMWVAQVFSVTTAPPPGRSVPVRATAALVHAGEDGGTNIDASRGLLVANEPTLLDRIVFIVVDRITKDRSLSAQVLAGQLVDSLVAGGFLSASEAGAFKEEVLREVEAQSFPDCNRNGIDDATDIAQATSQDLNANARPDECEITTVVWEFSGVAAGGQVSATLQGYSGTCTVMITTLPGQTAATVAANFAAAVNADACLGAQGVTASAIGGVLRIRGLTLLLVSSAVTDAGLQHEMPIASIPTLLPGGLAALVLVLLIAAVTTLRRRRGSI